MFDRFFRMSKNRDDAEERPSLKDQYESWRLRRDVAAIMCAFGSLSDRRLAMIGLHRDTLFESVSDMMLEAERQRQIGYEVLEMLENATDEHQGQTDLRKDEERISVSEAA